MAVLYMIFLTLACTCVTAFEEENYVYKIDKPGLVDLECPQSNEVIFNITLTSKNTKYNCYGKQHTVLISMLNCYWRNRCSLELGNEIITFTDDETKLDCIGQIPDIIWYNFTCINEANIINSMLDIKENTNLPYGLIKSHDNYPWNQPHPQDGKTWQSVMTFLPPTDHHCLYLKFINKDTPKTDFIISDGDFNWTSVITCPGNERATLKYNVRSGIKFSGFLICFKWFKSKPKDTESLLEDVCSTFPKTSANPKNIAVQVSKSDIQGKVIGPLHLILKRPCKQAKLLRVGFSSRRNDDEFSFTKKSKGRKYTIRKKLKDFKMKKMKKVEFYLKRETVFCYKWEKKKIKGKLDCTKDFSSTDETMSACDKKGTKKTNRKNKKGRKKQRRNQKQ